MEKSTNLLFSKRLRQLRDEKNMTQEDLALKLGLKSKSSIANYENGNNLPSIDVLLKLANVLNCSVDYLIGASNNCESKAEEILSMNIAPLTIMEIEKLLNWLSDNETYIAQIGNIKIKYEGVFEDTANGKRQAFYLERKMEW